MKAIYYLFIAVFALYKLVYKLFNALFINIGVLLLLLFKICYNKPNKCNITLSVDNLISVN